MDSEKERYSRFFFFYLVFNYQLILTHVSFILSFLLFFSSKIFCLSAFVCKKKKLMEKNARQIGKSFSHKIVEKVVSVSQTRASRAKVFHNYASFLF